MKRTHSTTINSISRFSLDWHCTSFKKNAVKYIQWLLKYLFRHVNKKIIFYFWPFQWKPFRINVMETTLMHLIARNYVSILLCNFTHFLVAFWVLGLFARIFLLIFQTTRWFWSYVLSCQLNKKKIVHHASNLAWAEFKIKVKQIAHSTVHFDFKRHDCHYRERAQWIFLTITFLKSVGSTDQNAL